MKTVFKRVGVALLVCVAGWVAGCGKSREGITMAGSTAFQPFAEKLADQYMNSRPEVSITVQGGGSSLGIQSTLSGAAQIGMADLVKLPPDAASLKSVVVARDGIAVISREAGSGTRSSFEQIVGNLKLTSDALIQDSNGTIRETVANDANAVGYLSHGLVNDKIKSVTVDGFACTEDAIMAGNYKLVRPVFLMTKADASPACQAFLAYVMSPEGQDLIHKNGLIKAK